MGYLLIDPETGAGAYKIASGDNGGFLYYLAGVLVGLFMAIIIDAFIAALIANPLAAILLATMLAGAIAPFIASILNSINKLLKPNSHQMACFTGGLLLGLSILALLFESLHFGILDLLLGRVIPANLPNQCID